MLGRQFFRDNFQRGVQIGFLMKARIKRILAGLAAFLAVIYIVFYLAFVVLEPILVLAVGILTIGQRVLADWKKSSTEPPPD